MKVLMVNTPSSPRFAGGDLVQLRKTAEALRELGIRVDECFDAAPDGRGYDIAHVFNLRTIAATSKQVTAIARSGTPIVMSPIYLDPSLALWGTQAVLSVFRNARSQTELDAGLERLRRRELTVQVESQTFASDTTNRTQAGYEEAQRAILSRVAHLLPNSILEQDRLVKTVGVPSIPFTVVPYAVDPQRFLDPDPRPFVDRYDLRDFVLQAGRIEAAKNQLMLVYALRQLDIPVVLIGGQLQPEYRQLCERFGGRNLTIINRLEPDQLRSAYAAARLHVLPSWVETCGLVSMEAALANCELIVSTAGYELEYFRSDVGYCDPADTTSIHAAVVGALEGFHRNGPRRQRLKERILRDFTWQKAATLTLSAYEDVLASKGNVTRGGQMNCETSH